MASAYRKIGTALVVLLTFLTVLVLAPAGVAQAQQDIGDQWNRVGDTINISPGWPAGTEVVGLPAGIIYENGTLSGTVTVVGRWPVEARRPGGASTIYFQWLVTNGPPPGVPAEHLEVNPNDVSPRPDEGLDGVVWTRGFNDTTRSLDVTVWDLQQVGDYMYAGGEFQRVIENESRQEHNQRFLARFNVDTGKWDPTFRPTLDGNVHALELSPRGLLLVGGEFTNIDGLAGTEGLAAINPDTGQVDQSFGASVERPWYPEGRAIVREIEVVGDYLYVGGNFSHVNGPGGTRVRVNKVVRVGANYGTIDATWNPIVAGGSVWGIGVDQDRGRVHLNGRFLSVNGDTSLATYAAVDTETGATVTGVAPRPVNQATRPELYDVEYMNDSVLFAGSQHFVAWTDADTGALGAWNKTGDRCVPAFYCFASSGAGGDFQFVEKIGNFAYSGCHCNSNYDRNGLPNHYSSVTGQRTTHRVVIAYGNDGAPSETEFDIGGNIDGGWTVATDDRGCIWFGGDIIDGGFYEPGGRVFARGFARFCAETPIPNTPTNLTAPIATADQISLSWQGVQSVPETVGYTIFRNGFEVGTSNSFEFTNYVDNNVRPGATYTYEVRARNRAGQLSEPAVLEVSAGFADVTPPSVPANVDASQLRDAVEVTWDASTDNAGVQSYLIYRDGTFLDFVDADTLTFTDVPPVIGRTYVYEVRAVDINENRSEPSAPASVVFGGEDNEPPTAPETVIASDIDGGNVEVQWTESTDNAGVQSYLVYRDGGYIGWTERDDRTFVDTGRTNGVTYRYSVRAVDVNDNRSELSEEAVVAVGGVDDQPPTVPGNVSAVDQGDRSVLVSWDASTDNVGVDSYLVYRDGSYIGWSPAGTTTYVDAGLTNGVTYAYSVRAVDSNENRSERSADAVVIPGGEDTEPPSVPGRIGAVDLGNGDVEVSWLSSIDNVGVASYLVYRDGAFIGWSPGDANTYTDTGLANGVSYSYTVRAVDLNDNRSEPSGAATVAVGGEDLEAPSVPGRVGAVDLGDRSVQVSWDASTDNVGIASYLVYRDGAFIGWTQSDVLTYIDPGLTNGVSYDYSVRAVDLNDNRSARSAEVPVAVGGEDLEAPTVPGRVGAVDLGDGTIEVSWLASIDNIGVASYLVYRDGAYIGWAPAGTVSYVDTPPTMGVTYAYSVRAVDVNDNRSERSGEATVLFGDEDVEPPSIPVNLQLNSAQAGAVEIVWDPSFDNVAVNSYLVYRDGAYIGWTPGGTTTFTDLTAVAGNTHDYEVRAVDANNNRSDKSTPLTVDVV